jgi:hypothetical protein
VLAGTPGRADHVIGGSDAMASCRAGAGSGRRARFPQPACVAFSGTTRARWSSPGYPLDEHLPLQAGDLAGRLLALVSGVSRGAGDRGRLAGGPPPLPVLPGEPRTGSPAWLLPPILGVRSHVTWPFLIDLAKQVANPQVGVADTSATTDVGRSAKAAQTCGRPSGSGPVTITKLALWPGPVRSETRFRRRCVGRPAGCWLPWLPSIPASLAAAPNFRPS